MSDLHIRLAEVQNEADKIMIENQTLKAKQEELEKTRLFLTVMYTATVKTFLTAMDVTETPENAYPLQGITKSVSGVLCAMSTLEIRIRPYKKIASFLTVS